MKTVPPPTRYPPCTRPGCTCHHNPRGYPTGCDQGFEPRTEPVRRCKTCVAYGRRKADERAAERAARKTATRKETSGQP